MAKMIGDHEQELLSKFSDEFQKIKELSHKVDRDATLNEEQRAELAKQLKDLGEDLEKKLK